MDTANALPILWIENLVSVLKRWQKNGSLRDKNGYVDRLVSLVQQMKYSYLEPDEIAERFVKEMSQLVKAIVSLPLTEKQRRFVSYLGEEIEDLPRKLRLNPTEPFQVFRYRFVTITSVSDHPTLDLKITRVRDRHGVERTVITNVKSVKEGKNALIVLLPPKEFDGIWSEGMFVQFDVSQPSEVNVEDLRRLNAYFNLEGY